MTYYEEIARTENELATLYYDTNMYEFVIVTESERIPLGTEDSDIAFRELAKFEG